MIGAKNVSVIANTLGPEDYNYLKNQEIFITDSEYLNYQSLPRPKNEAPVGSKTPEWHDPDYKNETTAEQQTELERIRQESLKNLRQ
ncbi:hypothetical protein LPICM02_150008 [Pseudolactococcus piscium]|nr:hypothetical protein LPICM02_150008 [Lactococcus piscium]